jgi:hypothetical protein
VQPSYLSGSQVLPIEHSPVGALTCSSTAELKRSARHRHQYSGRSNCLSERVSQGCCRDDFPLGHWDSLLGVDPLFYLPVWHAYLGVLGLHESLGKRDALGPLSLDEHFCFPSRTYTKAVHRRPIETGNIEHDDARLLAIAAQWETAAGRCGQGAGSFGHDDRNVLAALRCRIGSGSRQHQFAAVQPTSVSRSFIFAERTARCRLDRKQGRSRNRDLSYMRVAVPEGRRQYRGS